MKLIKSILLNLTVFLSHMTLVHAASPGVGYPIMFTGRIITSVNYNRYIDVDVNNGFGSSSSFGDKNHSFYFMLLPDSKVNASINIWEIKSPYMHLCKMEVSSKDNIISVNVEPYENDNGIIKCSASGDPNQDTLTITIDVDEKIINAMTNT